jgi:hypothetical protein
MTTAPTPRASLLAGLRTGGVRSTSSPLANVPHTAAPAGTFNVPHFASQHHSVPLDEEEDDFQDMPSYHHHLFANSGSVRSLPLTAAVDGQGFTQQQKGLNPNSVPFNPAFGHVNAQNAQVQALQLQMMQLEIMKLQVCR